MTTAATLEAPEVAMPVELRRVTFHNIHELQTSKSKRHRHDPSFDFMSVVSQLSAGMVQEHREGGRLDGRVHGYTKLSDVAHAHGYTILVIERGSLRLPDPMLGAGQAEAVHVEVGAGMMSAWSCHVLIGTERRRDGTFNMLIERVDYLPPTDIESFLNHLLFREEACRQQYEGYMAYFKVELSTETKYTLGNFLRRSGVPADLEVIVPDGTLDSGVPLSFEVSYSTRLTTDALFQSIGALWGKARSMRKARLRVKSRESGSITVAGDFDAFHRSWADMPMSRTAELYFEPALAQHHTRINQDVVDQLLSLLRTA
jgi:hypothetical protein